MSKHQNKKRSDLPRYLIKEIQPIEREAWVKLRIGHYEEALQLYSDEYQLFQRAQARENRSLHKADPLYWAGICKYWQREFESSIGYFLLAYCEDVLSASTGDEDNSDRLPACNVLRDTYLIDLTFLRLIKVNANNLKKTCLIPLEPNKLLLKSLENTGVTADNLLALCQSTQEQLQASSLDSIIANWPTRVFIGGSFRELPRLRDIQGIVIRLNFNPILTHEVKGTEQSIHHHNLMLLHTCKYAIFEVTRPEGQLMEIERTRDYDILPLLVCSSMDETDESRVKLSDMLETAGFTIHGYRDTTHLSKIICEYLKPPSQKD
ncbi:MAG: hypothetical protein ACQCN3_12000 [Candidatus Bathyarchaeia archaeon]